MSQTVITAKLVRGKTYSYLHGGKYVTFERSVPKEVDEDLADKLEELVAIVKIEGDEDHDEIEKPMFRIDRNAQRATDEDYDDEDGPPRIKPRPRMRIVPADERKREAAPAPKRKPLGSRR